MGEKTNSGGYSNTPAQRTESGMTKHRHVNILLDYLSFTFDSEFFSVGAVLDWFDHFLKIPHSYWKEGRQNYEGYARSKVFENINIYYEGQAEQGIHVDITGQGCRYLEVIYQKLGVHKINWFVLINELKSADVSFTRIDIAIDDHHGFFTVPELYKKCQNGELTMKFKSWCPDGYFDADGIAKKGMTLYFGSDVSRVQIVIYEKDKQLGLNQKWTRTEIRYKHERANEFIDIFLLEHEQDLGVICASILKHYITFREPNPKDSNKRRWKVSPFWEEFLSGIEPRRLTSALPDRSILKMRSWVNKQVSKALAMMYFAYQDINDGWLNEVLMEGYGKMGAKDLEIIKEYRRLFEKEFKSLDNTIIINPNDAEKKYSKVVNIKKEHSLERMSG